MWSNRMELIETCFLTEVSKLSYATIILCDTGLELEVARVTFSDSDSPPVPKFSNPGPAIFQI